MPGRDDERQGETERAEIAAAAFETFPLPLASLRGPEHRFVAVNAAYRALSGRSNIVGGTLREAFPEVDDEQLFAVADRVYGTGETEYGDEWRVEVDSAVPGAPAEVYVDFVVAANRDPDGVVVGVDGAVLDVTRRGRDPLPDHHQDLDSMTTLQDALLPEGLAVLPRLDLAGRYLLADQDTSAGGDWFDSIPTRGGGVALVVGDVVGHGVEASAVMGQLRAVLGAALHHGEDPAAALQFLDGYAGHLPAARAATVLVVVLDETASSLRYCTAGHPPPLLVSAEGDACFLPTSGAGPLGSGLPFTMVDHDFRDGDVLMLYSDGLVARPGRTHASNTVELLQVAVDAVHRPDVTSRASTSAPERVCQTTLEMLTGTTGYTDDITLLVAQRRTPVRPLHLEFAARPALVREARTALTGWLAQLRVRPIDDIALRHAVGELVTNAVEHGGGGRGDRDTRICVSGQVMSDGRVQIDVEADGGWHESSDSGRGRGLAMARGFVDEMSMHCQPTGTSVRIRHRVSRPAQLLTGRPASVPPPRSRGPQELEMTTEGTRLELRGPLDRPAAADRFRSVLNRLTRGGTRAVTVDLACISLLTSAGVQVLADVTTAADGSGQAKVSLVAPIGSPAQHVLDIVQLPYDTASPSV